MEIKTIISVIFITIFALTYILSGVAMHKMGIRGKITTIIFMAIITFPTINILSTIFEHLTQ